MRVWPSKYLLEGLCPRAVAFNIFIFPSLSQEKKTADSPPLQHRAGREKYRSGIMDEMSARVIYHALIKGMCQLQKIEILLRIGFRLKGEVIVCEKEKVRFSGFSQIELISNVSFDVFCPSFNGNRAGEGNLILF